MEIDYIETIGKRKSSIARISLFPSVLHKGTININGEFAHDYLQNNPRTLRIIYSPFQFIDNKNYNISAYVSGGGLSGQAEAVRLAISKALTFFLNDAERKNLKLNGLLTRNSLCKERRKYGLKKARKAPQYSKR